MPDDQISAYLWSSTVTPDSYAGGEAAYRAAVLEQYKLYVETADRVSHRRGVANTFFLTANTAILTGLGTFWQAVPDGSRGWLAVPLVVLVVQCLGWYRVVGSYRQLSSAKWRVVAALEERLPASPYWLAEWQALGWGRDPRRYRPLTHLEQWVPLAFGLFYGVGYLLLVLG